jgi:hypothetical protein
MPSPEEISIRSYLRASVPRKVGESPLYDTDRQLYISVEGFTFLAVSGRILRSAPVQQGEYSSRVAQLNFG